MGTIRSYKFTENFNYKEITQNAIELFRGKVLKDAVIIEKDGGWAFVFKHGVAICWEMENVEFMLRKLSLSATYKNAEEFAFIRSSDQMIKIESDTVFIDSTDARL